MVELDWLKKWNMYSPMAIAIEDGETGRSLTYQKLTEQAQQWASCLKKTYQIQKGDRVAVLSSNELEHVVLFFALHRLGAILVPMNFRLTQRELDHVISDSKPKLIVFEKTYEENLAHLKDQQALQLASWESFKTKVSTETELFNAFLGVEDDPVLILYTSGTTGAPKGALLTHKMIFWNSINTSLRLNVVQSDCAVIFLPFFHTGAWNVLTTPFLHRGAKLVIVKKFDPELILNLSEKHKATLLFGVPTTMDMMSRTDRFTAVDLTSVRYAIVGGEPMPIPLIQKWNEKGIPIRQGYGLTEFGPNVFSLNEQDALRKIGSIGFPNFYIDVLVVDDQRNPVPQGEVGELLLKGPMSMAGYWQNPKATQETLKEGWLSTGDLVRQDSEGYFYVVGRKKDMYISGGENVYPPEVEQVIRKHPEVLEVAVVGVPDEKWGEVGKAFVVTKSQTSADSILLHCKENLAKYKIPKFIEFRADLPKGDSGKILKRALVN